MVKNTGQSNKDSKPADHVADIAPWGFEVSNPAKNNHDGENGRSPDGKVKRDILRCLLKMVHRVRNVDVCGEDGQVRGHKKLDPKLRVMRPSKVRVSDDLL